MELDDLFQIGLFLAWIIYQVVGAKKRRQDGRDPVPGPPPAARTAPRPVQEAAAPAGPSPRLLHAVERAEALTSRLTALDTALDPGLQRRGPTAALHDVIRGSLGPALRETDGVLRRFAARSTPPDASDHASIEAHIQRLSRATLQVQALDLLARWRRDPRLSGLLMDADAVAAAVWQPVTDLARAQGIDVPRQRPICAPAVPGGESVWFGLLPAGYPVVFVPDDFDADLYRWPSLAHEVGPILWREVPGLAQELTEALRLDVEPDLPSQGSRGWVLHPDQAVAAWLPEIFADTFTAVVLGPAALRGLMYVFRRRGAREVAPVSARNGMTYDEHPPPALRVWWTARVLHQMGFDREAAALREAWEATEGFPDFLALPTALAGTHLRVPVDPWRDRGDEVVDALYSLELEALQGFSLGGIPGLETSPGVWGQVQRRAADLRAGKPFTDDGRIVLAAAIEARAQGAGSALEAAVRRAILGLDADERRPDTTPRPKAPGGLDLEEVRAAFMLREVLERPVRPGVPPWMR